MSVPNEVSTFLSKKENLERSIEVENALYEFRGDIFKKAKEDLEKEFAQKFSSDANWEVTELSGVSRYEGIGLSPIGSLDKFNNKVWFGVTWRAIDDPWEDNINIAAFWIKNSPTPVIKKLNKDLNALMKSTNKPSGQWITWEDSKWPNYYDAKEFFAVLSDSGEALTQRLVKRVSSIANRGSKVLKKLK